MIKTIVLSILAAVVIVAAITIGLAFAPPPV